MSARRSLLFWVMAGFVCFYLLLGRGKFISTDEVVVAQVARSLWETGIPEVVPSLGVWGRDRRAYSIVNDGQPLAAAPLYGLGKMLRRMALREGWHRYKWIMAMQGPKLANSFATWAGDFEIVCMLWLNVVLTALLVGVFLQFCMRLQAPPRWALTAAVAVGCATYTAGYFSSFYQQTSEALFLLWSFYWLFEDRRSPRLVARLLGGAAVVLMLSFRYPAGIFIPGLLYYHGMALYQRRARLRDWLGFPAMVALAFTLHFADQYWKFCTMQSVGNYGHPPIDLFAGVMAYLVSPTESMFLFTPLLVLSPWLLRWFYRAGWRLETSFILLQTAVCLLFFGSSHYWHGFWCFGPRYTTALPPLLLLPLASWLPTRTRRIQLLVLLLALAGVWVFITNVVINWWTVACWAGTTDIPATYDYFWQPAHCQIYTHTLAMRGHDMRSDMWLLNIYRRGGMRMAAPLGVPLLLGWFCCVWRAGVAVMSCDRDDAGGAVVTCCMASTTSA
jgi:hypothetical protein